MSEPIGLFGGTFDPIHYGHLRTAFELWQGLRLAQVRFLPTGDPPHRGPTQASAELRLQMVRAAVAGQSAFLVDDREMRRSGVSYSVDTLLDLRGEFPERSLCLLLGMDAFLGMPNWHRWREIFDLAHVVVAHRPGWKAPITGPLGEVMVDRGTGSVRDLHQNKAGRVYVLAVTQLEISSTDLRQLIYANRDLRYLVPDAVRDLIVSTGCYAQQ
jgi:nicotinate-nucleotide adenylyltransferase